MIEVRELLKYYGEHRATGPLSFTIDEGEIVGLLGLNGAGKTTALRVLACDLLPSSGTVLVDGIDVVDDPHEVRRRIGYLPDRPPLYDEMTVGEYLVFAARLRGVPRRDARSRAAASADAARLSDVLDAPIGTLSHGYRQRVGIAQAIVHAPRLLILDEPISGLDPVQIVEMRELLRSLRGEHTIVLSSHILTEISETCDRLLVLGEGRIVASGTEAELARMVGERPVDVTIRADDPARAALALAGIEGVSDVRSLPSARGTGAPAAADVATLRVEADRDVREAIAPVLVAEGVALLEMVRAKHELESVFLELTVSARGDEAETRAGELPGASEGASVGELDGAGEDGGLPS